MRDEPDLARREVRYFGRVQGVGFRYTARQLAAHFSVTGCVQNLSDGTVALTVEGNSAEIDRYLDLLAETMSRYIESAQVAQPPATGEFSRFEVRH